MFEVDFEDFNCVVRLTADKVVKIFCDYEDLELEQGLVVLKMGLETRVNLDSDVYLGETAIESLQSEMEKLIAISLDGRHWHVLACSGKDTSFEDDRKFSDFQLLMMADGISCFP